MTETALPNRSARARTIAIVLALTLIAAGIGTWVSFRYDFIPKRFGAIVPNEVYRSGQISPRMIEKTIEKHHIQVIVDFQGPKQGDAAMEAEAKAVENLKIDYHRLPLSGDGTGKIENYAEALAIMVRAQKEHKPVLIHCSAGTQRTGAATVFYRLLIQKKSAQEAYEELIRYGADPAAKDAILVQYINSHMKQLAQLLVDSGVLEKIPDPLPQLPESR